MKEPQPLLRVRNLYAGKTILLTGVTGVLGKVVLANLFFKLPEVGRIFVLVRPPREAPDPQSGAERRLWEEVLQSSAFEPVRAQEGQRFPALCEALIRAVPGDLSAPGLHLAPEDADRLRSEVDLVLNCAAVANFRAPLDEALQTNTRGPTRLLELFEGVSAPPTVVHVSTCYVRSVPGPAFETRLDTGWCPRSDVEPVEYDAHSELAALERRVAETGGKGRSLRKALVAEGLRWAKERGWPNVYAFTKALGEQHFFAYPSSARRLVVRPSILSRALRFPEPGWIEGFRMVDPIVAAVASGRVIQLPGNPDAILDVIPVDVVADALVVAAAARMEGDSGEVVQIASGMENPFRLGEGLEPLREGVERDPLLREKLKRPLPERLFVDRVTFERESVKRGSSDELARSLAEGFGPYMEIQPTFLTHALRGLRRRLAPEDAVRFHLTVTDLDWARYFRDIQLGGVRRDVLGTNDPVPGMVEREVASLASEPEPSGDPLVRVAQAEKLLRDVRSAGVRSAALVRERMPSHGQSAFHAVIRWICRHYLTLSVDKIGALPDRGPFIVAANHSSHADTGIVIAALWPLTRTLRPAAAEDYWFKHPFLAWVLRSTLGAVPFDRHATLAAAALAHPAAALGAGHPVLLFPEGSRSHNGTLAPFRPGVGLLALATAVPVVPIHIEGAAGVLPRGSWILRPARVRVTIGASIDPIPWLARLDQESATAVARAFAGAIREEVERLGCVRSSFRSSQEKALAGGDLSLS